jgi:methyl-accepting chemotaxis protein
LRSILDKVQERRQVMAKFVNGDLAVKDHLSGLDRQIDAYFLNLEDLQHSLCVSDTYENELATGQMFSDLKTQWHNFQNNVSFSEKSFTELMNQIIALYTHAADTSNLVLDPELDTYHVIHVTVAGLDTAASLDILRTNAWASVVSRSVTPDEKLKLVAEISKLEVSVDRLVSEIRATSSNNSYYNASRDSLRLALDTDMQNFLAAARRFIAILREHIIGINAPAMHQTSLADFSPQELDAAGAAAQGSLYRFLDTATAWEHQALSSRIHYYLSKENRVLAVVGLVLLFSSGLVVAIARSVTRPLNEAVLSLTTASKEILATTSDQASGAREQAAAVAETATTADEITQAAQQAAQRQQHG